jgi:predicted phosphatase
MIDKDIDLAGIPLYRFYPMNEDEKYAFIQDNMLYELSGFIAMNNVKEFKIAMIEYLLDHSDLYGEAAEELLETNFVEYKVDIEGLLVLG